MELTTIIEEKSLEQIIDRIDEHINAGNRIASIKLVDENDDQVVILLSDEEITEETARAWWSGYKAGLCKT